MLGVGGCNLPRIATGAADAGDDDDVTNCPECSAEIYAIATRCPKCGHWFVEEDRRRMQSNRRSQAAIVETARELRIVKVAAAVLLVVLAICLAVAAVAALLSGDT